MLHRLRTGNFGALFSEGVEPNPAPPPAARRLRRQATLRETFGVRARRMMRVAAWLAQPRRLADAPAALALLLRGRLAMPGSLPDPRVALVGADGLAGLARDLAPAAMMEAYGKGLAPSASLGPIAWHSRCQRYVAAPAALARDARLRNRAEAAGWSVTFDREIDLVLVRCGRPRDSGPIMPARLLDAFAALFDAGFAHCFCVRDDRGEAIGGGFGVAVGGVFIIEGAFETKTGAAAFGFSHLNERLSARHFSLVECAPAAARLDGGLFGAMAREDFLAALALHMDGENIGRWRSDAAVEAPTPLQERRLAA
jgi:leucyl/phenylalanyl-tRNA--protein transferase